MPPSPDTRTNTLRQVLRRGEKFFAVLSELPEADRDYILARLAEGNEYLRRRQVWAGLMAADPGEGLARAREASAKAVAAITGEPLCDWSEGHETCGQPAPMKTDLADGTTRTLCDDHYREMLRGRSKDGT